MKRSSMFRSNRAAHSLLFVVPLLLAAQPASAIVTVGPAGGGCTYTSINAAINYVLGKERNAPNDVDPYIAVAGGYVYNEALVIDGSGVTSYTNPFGRQAAFVQIYGNYDGNCDDIPDGSTAYIGTGGGKVNHSVLEIKGSSPVDVVLNHLTLADAYGSVANGGGINVHTSGLLDLTNVEIKNNHAGNGGGIFADGHAAISITLHSGTWIHGNTADHAGGGIYIQGETRLFALEDQTLVEYNTVNNADSLASGGGLYVTGSQAVADIGSPGYFSSPTISNNQARYGGGVDIEDHGTVRLFSTYVAQPARIEYNTATINGGGVYLSGSANLCGDSYSISHNAALHGAAIYSNNFVDLTSQGLQCNSSAFQPDRAPCASGTTCNRINGNAATAGAVIYTNTTFVAERVELQGNSGSNILLAPFGSASLTNCLFAGNTSTESVISSGNLSVDSCTLADNTGTFSPPFYITGPFSLQRSIVWQPGAETYVAASGLSAFLTDLIVNPEAFVSYPGTAINSNVKSGDPRFVDPANGNYHLQPDSPAVDDSANGPAADLDGNPRHVNILSLAQGTTYDIGAFEVQSRGDLIFVDGLDRPH